ncbi:MAG: quinolinate synthase NadA [Armatimonadota bacterium]|nr:quinolinate synthase NadA [Armatimonadota bacterium]
MAPLYQQPLDERYTQLNPDQLIARIAAAKERLGSAVVILGHHYQRDEIIQFADFTGDSYKLSVLAAKQRDARYIVFCGVHFMAESADILAADYQRVILPNLEAGCSMADMATLPQVRQCWSEIEAVAGPGTVPLTYVNSSADLKAFCGEHGGSACTSSNAVAAMRWAFTQGHRVLFLPDEHLGRNTAAKIGVDPERCIVWDPEKELGGNTPEAVRSAQLFLWKGFCSVHQRFTVEQIRQARQRFPGVRVIVHPECRREVVEAADDDGSTEYIIRQVSGAPPGTIWGVGTEVNLVNRLARQHPEQTIFCLDPIVCPCSTMYRIHPMFLLWVLESLLRGEVVNEIVVDPAVIAGARVALERMLRIASG